MPVNLKDKKMRKFIILTSLIAVMIGCGGTDSVEKLKSEGLKAFTDGDYVKARKILLQVIEKNPSDKDLLFFTGMSYKREYLYDSALFYLKRADILYPKDREINKEIYEVSMMVNEWEYAIRAIMVLVDTGDKLEDYYYQLADLYARTDYPLNVFFYLRKAYSKGMDSPERFLQFANAAAIVDSMDLAFQLLDSAITRFGESNQFLTAKAKFYSYKENYQPAEEILRSLLARDTTSAEFKFNLANVLGVQDSKKKKKEALELYKAAKPFIQKFNVDSIISVIEQEIK